MSVEERIWKNRNPDQGMYLDLIHVFSGFHIPDWRAHVSEEMRGALPGIENRSRYEFAESISQYISRDVLEMRQQKFNPAEIRKGLIEKYNLKADTLLGIAVFRAVKVEDPNVRVTVYSY